MIPGHATPEGTALFAMESGAHGSNYKRFAGLMLSNVGIGTYLGDTDEHTDRMVSDAIVQSVRAGVNVIDTAINYRAQKAERSVGRAVSEMIGDGAASRDQLFICTKGGYVTNDADSPGLGFWEYVKKEYTDTGIVKPSDITSSYHCMSPAYLSNQIDRSLDNMGLECIDLAYLHNAAEGQLKEVTMPQFLERLRDAMTMYEEKRSEGKIRYYGMATWECFRTEETGPMHLSLKKVAEMARDVGGPNHGFRFIQVPFNMYYDQALLSRHQPLDGDERASVLEVAALLGIGAFTSVPYMQGRLLQQGTIPEFCDMPAPLRALQFIRSAPGVIAPLVGQKAPEHVQENLKIMNVPPITSEEFSELVSSLTSRQQ